MRGHLNIAAAQILAAVFATAGSEVIPAAPLSAEPPPARSDAEAAARCRAERQRRKAEAFAKRQPKPRQ